MLVRQAFRYELAPTAVQRAALANHAGAARWAWNWGLAVRRKAYRRRGETLTAVDLHRLLLSNRHLARAISDQGWAEFHRQLTYKCRWYGSRLLVAPRLFPSSKLCSACGALKAALPLDVRVFRCQVCGLVIDRDLNAANNLVALAALAGFDGRGVAGSSPETKTPVERVALARLATAW
jgi:transposase